MASARTVPALPGLVMVDIDSNLTLYVWRDMDATGDDHGRVVYTVGKNIDTDRKVPVKVTKPLGKDEQGPVQPIVLYGIPRKVWKDGNGFRLSVMNTTSTRDESNRVYGEEFTAVWLDDYSSSDKQWLDWSPYSRSSTVHVSKQVTLEVSSSSTTNPNYPSGSMAVEYERDDNGKIKYDSNGVPKVAKIDESGTSQDNLKVGNIVMTFSKDYFGQGKHAWLAGPELDFQIFHLSGDSPFNSVRARRGTLFTASGLFFDLFNPYSDPIVVNDGEYVWIQMDNENSDNPTFTIGSGSTVSNPSRPSILRYPLAQISISEQTISFRHIRPLQYNQANMKLALRGSVSLKIGDVEYTNGSNALYCRWQ